MGGQRKRTVASYYETAKSLLETYTADNVSTSTDTDMLYFIQLSNEAPAEYEEAI